ncbi:MAG TPA: hypothetical protein VLM11_07850 [Streptosporangiaceae bacterium]|nr:hypothetical protein [Streptosporangiaceae bacterium]
MPTAPPPVIAAVTTVEQSPDAPGPAGVTKRRGDRRRHARRLILRVLGTIYRDSLFERPDLVEDDYYRFLHQPRGW